MFKIYENIQEELTLKSEELIDFFELINSQNTKILRTSVFYMLFLNIVHIIIFYNNLGDDTEIETMWRYGIIILHSCFFILYSYVGINLYYSKKKLKQNKNKNRPIIAIVYLVSSYIAVMIALTDQLVTSSITPYLLAGTVLPIIFTLTPRFAIVTFISSYIMYVIFLPSMQMNSEIVLSNLANGFAICLISCFLAIRKWKITLQNFRQNRLIELQKKELEIQNSKLTTIAEELKESNATKDKFFSIISHDLRSPLSGFIGLTKLMSDEEFHFSENEIIENTKAMNESANNLYKLLDNLLVWAKVQGNNIEFIPVTINTYFIVNQIIEYLGNAVKYKIITIENKIPINYSMVADEQMVYTIFRNLITNACKFSNYKSKVEIGIFEEYESTDNSVICFYIKDFGIGMNDTIKNNLFKIDQRTSRNGTAGEPSSGLGLLLCKEFVELHKGKIWAESQENIGSIFFFTISKEFEEKGNFSESNEN